MSSYRGAYPVLQNAAGETSGIIGQGAGKKCVVGYVAGILYPVMS